MKTDFPYIEIPEHLSTLIGDPDRGTRMYRQYGTEDEMSTWFDAVVEICKPEGSVSPGGAAGYARVSRAGIHKRMKQGRLTAFLFNVVEDSKLLKGVKKLADGRMPYVYIPVSECKAWRKQLERAPESAEKEKEIMGDYDWKGNFMKAPLMRKWQRKGKG